MSGKKSKNKKVESIIEYLEPLSDISAIDLNIKKRDSGSFISGRFESATNKKLTMIPYFASKNCGVYVELNDDDLDYVEVKTVKPYSFMSYHKEAWGTKERYDKTIHFDESEMKIVGRFLRILSAELLTRNIKISTKPGVGRPETFVSCFINAGNLIGNKLKRIVRNKLTAIIKKERKEFFFKEKLREVNNADES